MASRIFDRKEGNGCELIFGGSSLSPIEQEMNTSAFKGATKRKLLEKPARVNLST